MYVILDKLIGSKKSYVIVRSSYNPSEILEEFKSLRECGIPADHIMVVKEITIDDIIKEVKSYEQNTL